MLSRVQLRTSSLVLPQSLKKSTPTQDSIDDRQTLLLPSHRFSSPQSVRHRHHHQSSSSKRFIRRAETDPYGKIKTAARGEPVYTARSAYKLIQLDQQFHLFPRRHPTSSSSSSSSSFRVLDLGASPGGWTEVILERLAKLPSSNRRCQATSYPDHRLIACDLLDLNRSIYSKVSRNIRFDWIQGDLRNPQTQARIEDLLLLHDDLDPGHRGALVPPPESSSQAQEQSQRTRRRPPPPLVTTIILSDMLAPISGVTVRDAQASFELSILVADLASKFIIPPTSASDAPPPRSDSALVLKHLQSELTHELRSRLLTDWDSLKWFKPLASRAESREGYFVCRDRKPSSSSSSSSSSSP